LICKDKKKTPNYDVFYKEIFKNLHKDVSQDEQNGQNPHCDADFPDVFSLEDAASHLEDDEYSGDEESDEGEYRRRRAEVAESHVGGRVVNDDALVLTFIVLGLNPKSFCNMVLLF